MCEAKSQSPWKRNRPGSIVLYPVPKQSFTTFCISMEIPDPGSDWFTGQLSLCLRILCSKIVKLFDAPEYDNYASNKSPIMLNKFPIMLLIYTYSAQVPEISTET